MCGEFAGGTIDGMFAAFAYAKRLTGYATSFRGPATGVYMPTVDRLSVCDSPVGRMIESQVKCDEQ